MAYNYDALYKSEPDALGAPTQVFVDFFAELPGTALRVLDVGCGQGRDALFIARLGHSVVGVDLSPHGVRDMVKAAKAEGLNVQGVTADITEYTPDGMFDVILIDRTLHMLTKDDGKAVLQRLLGHAADWVLIADEASNMHGFKDVIAESRVLWETTFEKSGYLFIRRQ